MLFYYLAPLQNGWLVMSYCMKFTFGDKREVCLLGESALPVTAKERRVEGKTNINPRMKYGHTNLISFLPIFRNDLNNKTDLNTLLSSKI